MYKTKNKLKIGVDEFSKTKRYYITNGYYSISINEISKEFKLDIKTVKQILENHNYYKDEIINTVYFLKRKDAQETLDELFVLKKLIL